MHSKIKKYLVSAFLVAGAVFIVAGGIYAKSMYDEVVRKQLSDRVQLLAVEKAARAEQFFQAQRDTLMFISTVEEFKQAALHPADQEVIAAAQKRISEFKEIVPGISIMNEKGIVAIGDIDTPGLDYSGEPYFALKEKRVYFQSYFCPIRKKYYFAAVGPIYDSLQTKKIIGAIAFDIGLDKINELMKESIESDYQDESYLIDEHGMLISESEFIGAGDVKGVFVQEIKSESSKDCLGDYKKFTLSDKDETSVESHTEKVPLYVNYMGETVVGAHGYVPSIMGCVISEIRYAGDADGDEDDEAEAAEALE